MSDSFDWAGHTNRHQVTQYLVWYLTLTSNETVDDTNIIIIDIKNSWKHSIYSNNAHSRVLIPTVHGRAVHQCSSPQYCAIVSIYNKDLSLTSWIYFICATLIKLKFYIFIQHLKLKRQTKDVTTTQPPH